MRDERGFTIVEVMVAALLLAIGIGTTIASFAAPQEQTLVGQRMAQASALAERELDELTNRPFIGLGLTSMPVPVSDPSASPVDPRAHLRSPATCGTPSASSTTCLRVRQSFNDVADGPLAGTGASGEPLVPADKGVTPSETINGMTVHRFVTWKDREACAPSIDGGGAIDNLLNSVLNLLGGLTDALTGSVLNNRLNVLCMSGRAVKRVTVAVTVPPGGNQAGPLKPVWMSTLVPNPGAGLLNPVGGECTKLLFIPLTCSRL